MYESYLPQTADVSARAGEIYDDLTAHGTNAVDEKTAAVRAFAKQAEEAKQAQGGTTKPAAKPAGPIQEIPLPRKTLP